MNRETYQKRSQWRGNCVSAEQLHQLKREEDKRMIKAIDEAFPELEEHERANIKTRLLLMNVRRKALDSHLFDTLEIYQLLPEPIKQTALIHDIGKTGPAEAPLPLQEGIARIYGYVFGNGELLFKETKEQPRTIAIDVARKIFNEQQVEQIHEQGKNAGVRLDQLGMRDFFAAHTWWGQDVVGKIQGGGNWQKTRWIALNHHRTLQGRKVEFDGFIPTKEDENDALMIEAVDYYQARRRRGQRKHNETITEIINKYTGETAKNRGTDVEKEMKNKIIPWLEQRQAEIYGSME